MDSLPVSEEEVFLPKSEVLVKVAAVSCRALCQLLEMNVEDPDKLEGVLISVSCVQQPEACCTEPNGIRFAENTREQTLSNFHRSAKEALDWEDQGGDRFLTTNLFVVTANDVQAEQEVDDDNDIQTE